VHFTNTLSNANIVLLKKYFYVFILQEFSLCFFASDDHHEKSNVEVLKNVLF